MRNYKKIILISTLVFLAAACNYQAAYQPAASQSTPTGQTQIRQNAGGSDYFPNGQQPGGVAKAPTITVYQTVQGSNLNQPSYTIPDGEKAIDLLKGSHTVTTKSYSGLGEFVTSIDGIAPDSQHFWEFFVNGASSNVGASNYTLKNGDKIEWKLSKINSSGN